MDVRFFKFLIFLALETIFAVVFFLVNKMPMLGSIRPIFSSMLSLLVIAAPILLLLPEDNWIWLVEEDPRVRKITMRSKAVKHLHMSMLYFFAIGFPCLIVTLAMLMRNPAYYRPALVGFALFGAAYGFFCAYRHNRNVRKHASLFAVGWDRRSSFFEIFVGLKVSRRPKYFFSKPALWIGFLYVAAAAATPYYYSKLGNQLETFDMEKFMVMHTLFSVFFAIGVWITTMYVVFQIFFSRRLERWIREVTRERP
ncbi:MAG: hypothetical protein ABIH66_10710 [bacterium]